ncbi:glycosyltransferase family 2 protein [Flavobacterium sp. ZS1P70]|uniref:Glycosyltransferase family 2 protein n=1 Tax=Flavobacterium zhoui TaxID=3230414 RepID=A0ABW6I6R5_9FLAO
MKPLLSIVIATKNRVPYCINTVESLLKLEDEDLQVIVQDNTDTLELKEYVLNNFSDSRLIYNYTPPPFSSIDNFNACVGFATGEYLCMIGDDDGINPEFIKIARYAQKNGIESLGSSQIAEYYWPNAIEKYKEGNLSIPEFIGTSLVFDPSKRLIPLLMTGIVNYIPFNLPRVYHGLVKRSLLEQIKENNGNYFDGLSPDIYSTISLTTLVKKHVLIDYPMTIAGTCASSTSAASVNGEHNGKLEDAPHFRSRNNYLWDSMIPKYYSIQTIWAETGIKALKSSEKSYLIKYFNLEFLVAQSILINPNIKKLIMEQSKLVVKSEKKSIILFHAKVAFYLMLVIVRRRFNKLVSIFHKKKENRIHYANIENIEKATDLFKQYIIKRDFDVLTLFDKI